MSRPPTYNELACELLGKEELPLALARWPINEGDVIHYPGGLRDEHEQELQFQVCQLTDLSPNKWPDLKEGQRIVWMRLAVSEKRFLETPDVDSDGCTPNDTLTEWVTSELKGKQRRVLELVIANGGSLPLADLAVDTQISWEAPFDDSFNSIRKVLNQKMKKSKLSWRLDRHDNSARLSEIS